VRTPPFFACAVVSIGVERSPLEPVPLAPVAPVLPEALVLPLPVALVELELVVVDPVLPEDGVSSSSPQPRRLRLTSPKPRPLPEMMARRRLIRLRTTFSQ
jgi:hypothetical protein